jgi:hypothetical protein
LVIEEAETLFALEHRAGSELPVVNAQTLGVGALIVAAPASAVKYNGG